MYEIWICGRWEGADLDLAERAKFEESARRKAEKWQERGFKTAMRDERGRTVIEPQARTYC